jgi:3-deoxy-D-manno-octulosonic-acid transferase
LTLYHLAISLYALIIRLLKVFGHKRAKQFIKNRQNQTIICYKNPHFWIHAASAGEGNQAIPIAQLLKAKINCNITISFFSSSGIDFHQNTTCFDQVLSLPLDKCTQMTEFIDKLQPTAAIFIRKELWWNALTILNQKKIPTFLVNAHPKRFLNNKWLQHYHLKCLALFNRIYFTENPSQNTFNRLSVSTIIGDTKYESAFNIDFKEDVILEDFCQSATVLMIGSSWPEEEKLIAEFLNNHLQHEDLKVVIFPHDIQPKRLNSISDLFHGNCVFYSNYKPNNSAQVLIVDSIGKLKNSYPYADIAIVGGGMGKGIHNILEAIACYKAVLIGPNYHRFSEAVELVEKQLVFAFKNGSELQNQLEKLIQSKEDRLKINAQLSEYVKTKKRVVTPIVEEILKAANLRISG